MKRDIVAEQEEKSKLDLFNFEKENVFRVVSDYSLSKQRLEDDLNLWDYSSYIILAHLPKFMVLKQRQMYVLRKSFVYLQNKYGQIN